MPDRVPKLPTVAVNYLGEQYERLDVRLFADMSPTQAKAMTETAKYTYAVPARQETYRYLAALIFAGVLLIYLLPAFLARNPTYTILAIVILGVLGILSADRIIKAAIQAIKGS